MRILLVIILTFVVSPFSLSHPCPPRTIPHPWAGAQCRSLAPLGHNAQAFPWIIR